MAERRAGVRALSRFLAGREKAQVGNPPRRCSPSLDARPTSFDGSLHALTGVAFSDRDVSTSGHGSDRDREHPSVPPFPFLLGSRRRAGDHSDRHRGLRAACTRLGEARAGPSREVE